MLTQPPPKKTWQDTDDIDFLLSMSMSEFGNCIFQLLATVIFIAVVQPWILVGIGPLAVVYYFLQKYYRRSNIELQRLDAVSRSPIYAHFSETLSGVETIRAYRLAEHFALSRWAQRAGGGGGGAGVRGGLRGRNRAGAAVGVVGRGSGAVAQHGRPPLHPLHTPPFHPLRSDAKVDSNHAAYFTARMANEWLSMRLDAIGACVVLGAALLAIIRRDDLDPSLAALTMSEALDITMFLKAAVTSGAMFETRFNSGAARRARSSAAHGWGAQQGWPRSSPRSSAGLRVPPCPPSL
jgi:ABC-type multidrug transport system fused ATPase/permease subunit